MDLRMDIRNELDFQFLDLHDLNDNDKNHLIGILKSNVANDTLKLPWDTVESGNDVNASITEIPQVHNQWYHNAMPPQPSYAQQIMCSDWQGPIYPVPTDAHIQPFMPAMTYSHPGYNLGNEIHDVSCNREGNRRNNRGRGIRRDNFNRGINPTNEMQSGYMGEQGQFHPPLSFVVMYPDQTQQQQFSGHVHYPPLAIYQPNIHTHTNTHPHTQPAYGYPPYHHPSGNIRCVRQAPPMLSQPTQECTKVQATKSHEKRVQNLYTPVKQPFHQVTEEDNSSQTNIVTTVITVNNSKVEQCTDNVDENTANRKTSNTNGKVPPVNVKIEHNIVSTVNEKCNGAEKNDVPCVNINSSIEVKQNGETDKEYKNETVSSIKTTVVKTLSKPICKNENETHKEDISRKNGQDEIIIKTPSNSSSAANTPIIVPATPSPALSSISWASILKKGSAEAQQNLSNYKPTARINPLPVTENNITSQVSPQSTEKDQPSSTILFTNENISSNIRNESKNSQAESLHNHYNDPIAFRMGEFLLSYQMDKQTVSLLPRGLTNRSNYCYINSILQALLACPPFYNLLMALPHSKNSNKMSSTPLIDNMIKFVHEFTPLSDGARLARKDRANKRGEDLIVDIQSGVAFEPFYVYTMLKNTSAAGVFSVEGRQEDAEEFLSCLLNGINDEMLELIKLVNNDQNLTNNIENNISYNNGEEEWKVMGPKNKGSITRCTEFGRTPLSDIFRGQLRSRVSRAGEQPTDNVQPFFTLQLDIEKAESVKGALEILVGKDQLEGMTCSKTKQQIEAWKQVTLEELPVILILHLKWFDYKLDGCSKIVKSVEFPIDLKLDSKFLSPNAIKKLNPKQKHYKLFAVTYHDGKEATKGHYVTDAFHVGYGGWVRYDDSSLKGVSESNVLKPTPPRVPYLLYYRRCDTIGNNQSNSGKPR